MNRVPALKYLLIGLALGAAVMFGQREYQDWRAWRTATSQLLRIHNDTLKKWAAEDARHTANEQPTGK